MTAVWGPLGWMTLHSVATSYPESPTESEKQLMYSWLEMFRDTITCPYCRDHFTSLLANYRIQFPTFLSSRRDFALFSFRAHNDVNRRLKKPVYANVSDCMTTLQKNIQTRTAKDYRVSYLNHIQRYFSTLRDATGIAALRKISEMYKIENQYISSHDTQFNVEFIDESATLGYTVLNKDPNELQTRPVIQQANLGRISIMGGRFRIQR
jgi:Erv1 / Alr family